MAYNSHSARTHSRYACDECEYYGEDYHEFKDHQKKHNKGKDDENTK